MKGQLCRIWFSFGAPVMYLTFYQQFDCKMFYIQQRLYCFGEGGGGNHCMTGIVIVVATNILVYSSGWLGGGVK